VECCFVD